MKWNDTRPDAFGTIERINRLKVAHGYEPLTPDQYEAARADYHQRNPHAKPQDADAPEFGKTYSLSRLAKTGKWADSEVTP